MKSPTRSSTGRSRWFSMRRRTACTRRRAFWPGAWKGVERAETGMIPEKWGPVFGQDHAATRRSQFPSEPLNKANAPARYCDTEPRTSGGFGRRHRSALRGFGARFARARGSARPRGRHDPDRPRLSPAGRETARRGHRARRVARDRAEVRGPLHPADQDRRPGTDAGGRFHDARQGAGLRAVRQGRPSPKRLPRDAPARERCSGAAISR